jgi:nitric oxide reductase NorQ protein
MSSAPSLWPEPVGPRLAFGSSRLVSYNPGYQNLLKGLKPSTRQRFVSMRFDFPSAEREQSILLGETGCDADLAKRLVGIGKAFRALKDRDLEEVASTRLLVYAATLIKSGFDVTAACRAALVESLTDDEETVEALMEIVNATFGR